MWFNSKEWTERKSLVMTDFAQRRTTMVDTQVRPSDVTKFPIIDAMLAVPRERFVPDFLREAAYMGEHVPLGDGRVVLDPYRVLDEKDALAAGLDYITLGVTRP